MTFTAALAALMADWDARYPRATPAEREVVRERYYITFAEMKQRGLVVAERA